MAKQGRRGWAVDEKRKRECADKIKKAKDKGEKPKDIHVLQPCPHCSQQVCIVCNRIPDPDDPEVFQIHGHYVSSAGKVEYKRLG